MNKRFAAAALTLAALVVVAACGSNESETRPVTTTTNSGTTTAPPASEAANRDNALVRAVNASVNSSAIDLFVDNDKQFPGVTYKATTPYKEIPEGRHNFAVKVAGMDSSRPMTEDGEGLDDGKHYTAFVLPGDDNARADIYVVEDDLKLPASGKARVRIVHGVRDGEEIDIYAPGKNDAIFENIEFQDKDGYDDIDPYTGNLEVRPEGKKNVLLTIQNARLEANKAYTIVIVGEGKENPKLEAFVIEDQVGAAR